MSFHSPIRIYYNVHFIDPYQFQLHISCTLSFFMIVSLFALCFHMKKLEVFDTLSHLSRKHPMTFPSSNAASNMVSPSAISRRRINIHLSSGYFSSLMRFHFVCLIGDLMIVTFSGRFINLNTASIIVFRYGNFHSSQAVLKVLISGI